LQEVWHPIAAIHPTRANTMRIKRFTAPDMRTALRKVRDEQGPDAVILSTRASADGTGIEVVAATDYDEALVAQALRAATPAGAETPARPEAPAPAAQAAADRTRQPAATIPSPTAAPVARDGLMSRARAVFRIGDGPTLAELTGAQAPAAAGADPAPASAPAPSRFDAMMAALEAGAPPMPPVATARATSATASTGPAAARPEALDAAGPRGGDAWTPAATAGSGPATPGFIAARMPSPVATPDPAVDAASQPASAAIQPASASTHRIPAPTAATPEPASPIAAAGPRLLQAVAGPEVDPAFVAMREEMARMRQLMETQMEQLSLERLRGSPGRAAVLEALVGYGCAESLAREVAARIDPRLSASEVHGPMFDELARMVSVVRNEPLEEGGVIALVGPTGAGKTTTAAKLAARFAARHRARDVALVTTDCERAGALEQLQALGRRLGITVCEAQGPERLQDTLEQLVDYPLVLVDTTGHAPRDRAVFSQVLWLRASRKVRSLLVLPANAHPHDLGEVVGRYRPAKPEGVVLTKLDETGRLGSALSVLVRHGLGIAYTTHGQQVPSDLDVADAGRLVQSLEKSRRAADNPLATEDRHAVA
jgi:flagellar biosynthesis protein FlhF